MIHVIVNEKAKAGGNVSVEELVKETFREEGQECITHRTKQAGDARRIARELSFQNREKTIWVVGGDGTVNEVVNGLVINSSLKFGFVPAGSGNDYARGLGLPLKTKECIKALLHATKTKSYDVGRIELFDGTRLKDNGASSEEPVEETELKGLAIEGIGEENFVRREEPGVTLRFAGSSGCGYDANVCYEVDHSRLKKFLNRFGLGKLSYLCIAVKQVWANPRTNMTIIVDGVSRSFTDVIFACFMIHPYEGGGLKMCPNANATDRRISVVLAHGVKPLRVLLMLPTLMKGTHVKKDGIDTFDCQQIEVFTEHPQCIHTDGEVNYESRHFAVTCEEEGLVMPDLSVNTPENAILHQ